MAVITYKCVKPYISTGRFIEVKTSCPAGMISLFLLIYVPSMLTYILRTYVTIDTMLNFETQTLTFDVYRNAHVTFTSGANSFGGSIATLTPFDIKCIVR